MLFPDKNLGVLFTRGVSFSVWENSGILDREIKVYQELSKEYKRIIFFSYGVNESEKYSHLFPGNIEIVSRNRWIPKNIYCIILPILRIRKWLSVSVVKTNQMDGSVVGVVVKLLYGKKLLLRMGYEWLEYLERERSSVLKQCIATIVEYFAYKNADCITISSEASKQFIIKKFKISTEKIVVIPNYVDTERFSPGKEKKSLNNAVFVGRLEKIKNLENLFLSLKNLNIRLQIVGIGSLRTVLENKALSEGINVEFLGMVPQEELPIVLNNNGIFILPSITEGNPKALLEAMSCGLVCIGSDVPGINSIIKDGYNGFLSSVDVESIHNVLLKVLGNPDVSESIPVNARRMICENFSFDVIFNKEITIHKQLQS